MATASIQDIDTFIRLQKEKLNRDKYTSVPNTQVYNIGYNQPQLNNPNLDYNRQLDNYLNLTRNPSDPSLQFIPPEPQIIQNPRSQSPLLIAQQQQRESIPTHRITKQYKDNESENENFFQKFGSKYDAQKSKLKNELHQEYLQHVQQKNFNERERSKNQQVSNEFYATLPLQGLGATKNNSIKQRNSEYNLYKENNDKRNSYEFRKDKNDIEIKPYSKHNNGSQENLSNLKSSPFSNDLKSKSQSQFDVSKRVQFQQDPITYDSSQDIYRTKSANSYEYINRPQPIEAFRTPIPAVIDPSLADILRRPPVGLKSAVGLPPSRVQFNENVRFSDFPSSNQYPIQEPPRYNNNNNNYYNNDLNKYSSNQQLNNPSTLSARDAPFNFSEDQNKDAKALKAKEYQEELQRQMREKQFKKQREREEQDKLEKKISIENAIYNPYGRAGGGAPIRDKDGNTVADLSQVKADPLQYSPRDLPPPQSLINSLVNNPNPNFGLSSRTNSNEIVNFGFPSQQQQLNSSRKQGSNDEQTYARGGNGIFGEGKSEDQKKKEEKYKAELQRQIEEKQRLKALEKEKQRLEDEKEQKRVEEEQRKLKAEADEEERKKRAKEESDKAIAENAKRLADEKNKTERRIPNKPTNNRKLPRKQDDDQRQDDYPPPPPATEFRTNSPPVPAIRSKNNPKPKNNLTNSTINNKQLDNQNENRNFTPPPLPPKTNSISKPKSNATAEYYITESRLNVSSPSNKKISSNLPDVPDNEERPPSNLVTNYENNNFKENNNNNNNSNKKPNLNKTNSNRNLNSNIIPTKPVLRKVASRPPSQVSNSEVLAQLQSLKKHLHNELAEVENKVYNANNRTTVGQLTDLHQNILNVRTPPGDRFINDYGSRTYRKDIETPPLNGGLEPRTYFRDQTVLLGPNSDNLFANDLEREALDRQINRLNLLQYQNDAYKNELLNDELSAQNQLRLKKLRDLEDDSLSMNDPNDVLNKFITRNNRRPSAVTIHDDTWLKQPA